MSADRELLELAAKAAGIEIHHWSNGRKPHDCPVLNNGINETVRMFDPLTDDGDALRLAVKLKLEIGFGVINEVYAFKRKDGTAGLSQSMNDDPYAATRRAIVRAAAEIGKAMP